MCEASVRETEVVGMLLTQSDMDRNHLRQEDQSQLMNVPFIGYDGIQKQVLKWPGTRPNDQSLYDTRALLSASYFGDIQAVRLQLQIVNRKGSFHMINTY